MPPAGLARRRRAPGRSRPRSRRRRGAVQIGTGRDAPSDGGERRVRAHRRRAAQEPGGARRACRPGLADAADGPAVRRGGAPRGGASSTGWCFGFDPGACRRGSPPMSRRCASARGCCATGRPTRPGSARSRRRMAAHGVAVAAARREVDGAARRGLRRRRAGPFRARALALAGDGRGLARRACRRSPPRSASRGGSRGAARDARDRRRARSGRIAPISPCATPATAWRRRMLDRRAEGAADRDRAGPGAAPGDDARRAAALLLDEVAAHLEPRAGRRCSPSSAALGSQAWLTGTEPGAVRRARSASAQFFAVADGA